MTSHLKQLKKRKRKKKDHDIWCWKKIIFWIVRIFWIVCLLVPRIWMMFIITSGIVYYCMLGILRYIHIFYIIWQDDTTLLLTIWQWNMIPISRWNEMHWGAIEGFLKKIWKCKLKPREKRQTKEYCEGSYGSFRLRVYKLNSWNKHILLIIKNKLPGPSSFQQNANNCTVITTSLKLN